MILKEDQNLSEVLFKPRKVSVETSRISNSCTMLPSSFIENRALGYYKHWYRSINRFYWVWLGANWLDIEETLAIIAKSKNKRTFEELYDTVIEYGSGNWIYEFSTTGQKRIALAKKALENGDPELASHHYRMASRYFAIAAYPNLKGDVKADEASLLSYRAYREVFANSKTSGFYSEETFLVGTKNVVAYLHAPDNKNVYPCVIIAPTYELRSTDFYRIYHDYMQPYNMAVLIVDLPGTGGSRSLSFDINCDQLFKAAADHLKKLPYIDGANIGIVGYRLGAMMAVRTVALNQADFKAIALINPYVDNLFVDKEVLNAWPLCQRASLANRLDMDAEDWDTIIPTLQTFSLKKQGLLSYSPKYTIPCLNVVIDQDTVSKADCKLIETNFKNCETFNKKAWTYKDKKFPIVQKVADFFNEKLH